MENIESSSDVKKEVLQSLESNYKYQKEYFFINIFQGNQFHNQFLTNDINLKSFLSTPSFFNTIENIIIKLINMRTSLLNEKSKSNNEKTVFEACFSLLVNEVNSLNSLLPSNVYLPFLKDSIRNYFIVYIPISNMRLFKKSNETKVLFQFEVIRIEEINQILKENYIKQADVKNKPMNNIKTNEDELIRDIQITKRNMTMSKLSNNLGINEKVNVNTNFRSVNKSNRKNSNDFLEEQAFTSNQRLNAIKMLIDSDIKISKPITLVKNNVKTNILLKETKIIVEQDENESENEDESNPYAKDLYDNDIEVDDCCERIIHQSVKNFTTSSYKSPKINKISICKFDNDLDEMYLKTDDEKNRIVQGKRRSKSSFIKQNEKTISQNENKDEYNYENENDKADESGEKTNDNNEFKGKTENLIGKHKGKFDILENSDEEDNGNIEILKSNPNSNEYNEENISNKYKVVNEDDKIFYDNNEEIFLRHISPYGNFSTWKAINCYIKYGKDYKNYLIGNQLAEFINQILLKERMNSIIYYVEVVPIDNLMSLFEYINNARSLNFVRRNMKSKTIKEFYINFFGKSKSIKESLNMKEYVNSMKNFINSYAGYVLFNYIMNVNPKYNERNILINSQGYFIYRKYNKFYINISKDDDYKSAFHITNTTLEILEGYDSSLFNDFINELALGLYAIHKNGNRFIEFFNITMRGLFCSENDYLNKVIEILKGRLYLNGPSLSKLDCFNKVVEFIKCGNDAYKPNLYNKIMYFIK